MTFGEAGRGVFLRDLGNGLILRRATAVDTEALAAFNAEVHRTPGAAGPDEEVAAWTRDLMSGRHPTCSAEDFTLVEDTRRGIIVSSLCLIPQSWSYGGIRLAAGRPELVGTHPEYRRRGLIRRQFELIHQWSEERGQRLQVIEGTPWYYRQFGYEMCLQVDGGRIGHQPHGCELSRSAPDLHRLRPAAEADLAFISRLSGQAAGRYLMSPVLDEEVWRYELRGRSPGSQWHQEIRIIESPEGQPAGFLVHKPRLHSGLLWATAYELAVGDSWPAVTPIVIRYLYAAGEAYAAERQEPFEASAFWLGADHPAYQTLPEPLPRARQPHAWSWYVRVADVPDFLRSVAPVLEQRLARSEAAGHTGELRISFYRGGLRLVFEQGFMTVAEPWAPTSEDEGEAAFPDLTFLQLLFGYRSLEELEHAFADCWAWDEGARVLLPALFPKQPSRVWSVV